MPQRLLRPGINSSARVEQLGDAAECFYRRLMVVVDDFGRFEADPAIIRSGCYPRNPNRVTLEQIEEYLRICEAAGLVALYVVGNKRYLWYLNLGAPRAKKSIYPAPPENICERMHAHEDACEHTQANAPYSVSYSVSNTYSETGGVLNPVSKPKPPLPPFELDVQRFMAEYPLACNDHAVQILLSEVRTKADQDRLFAKLAEHKATDQWQRGIVPSPENYLRKGTWKISPKNPLAGAVGASTEREWRKEDHL